MKIIMYKEYLSTISEIFSHYFLLKSHTGFLIWNSIKDYFINKEIFTYRLLEKKPIKNYFYKDLNEKEINYSFGLLKTSSSPKNVFSIKPSFFQDARSSLKPGCKFRSQTLPPTAKSSSG